MANIAITSDAWTEISITSGTVQNISATADIELSAEQTDNSGVVLKPSEIYQWDNETIYARAVTESTGALRVVNFKKAAGGGGYVLPVATASTLGGVKVGNGLKIDENSKLYVPSETYSTSEQVVGTWIDGKPLYQKTYTGALSNENYTDYATHDATKIMVKADGYIFKTGISPIMIGSYLTSNYYSGAFSDYQIYYSDPYKGGEYIIIITYIKTTD